MFSSRPYLLALLANVLSEVRATPQNDAIALCAGSPGQFKCLTKTKFVICNGANSVAQDVAVGTECVDGAIVRAAAGNVAAVVASSSTLGATMSTGATSSSPMTAAPKSSVIAVPPSATGAQQSVPVVVTPTTSSALKPPAPTAPSLATATVTITALPSYSTKTLHSVNEVISFLASYPSQYPPASLTSISNALQPASTNTTKFAANATGATVVTLRDPKDVIGLLASNTSAYPPATLSSIASVLMPPQSVGFVPFPNISTFTMTVNVTGTTTVYAATIQATRSPSSNLNVSATSVVSTSLAAQTPPLESSARTKRGCKPGLPGQSNAGSASNQPSSTAKSISNSIQPSSASVATSTASLLSVSSAATAPSVTAKFPIVSTRTVAVSGTAKPSSTAALTGSNASHTSTQTTKVAGSSAAVSGKPTTSLSAAPVDFASPTGQVDQNKVVPITPVSKHA